VPLSDYHHLENEPITTNIFLDLAMTTAKTYIME
jgi:hypothetical protein